jgi:hypothetical protein
MKADGEVEVGRNLKARVGSFSILLFCTQNPVDSCAKIVIERNQKDWNR